MDHLEIVEQEVDLKPEDNVDRIVRVVIPVYKDAISPNFSVSHHFRVWEVSMGMITDFHEVAMYVPHGTQRVKLLRRLGTHVLICNGIENRYKIMLEMNGTEVFSNVSGYADDAIYRYLNNSIEQTIDEDPISPEAVVSNDYKLINWTFQLFKSYNWQVQHVDNGALFPVDLIASKRCRLCGKMVRVAICCGAHGSKVQDELRELKRRAISGFQVCVYVHPKIKEIVDVCEALDIELLAPANSLDAAEIPAITGIFPPLQLQLQEHN